jgi:uncharacterized membrane protein YeaQ/YmgE (transglycosylase-associated protein family)
MIINLILWLIVGALVGWIANYIISKDTKLNIADLVVGIVGALLGGWGYTMLTGAAADLFSIPGFVAAVIGALIVAFAYKWFTSRKSTA